MYMYDVLYCIGVIVYNIIVHVLIINSCKQNACTVQYMYVNHAHT